MVEKETHPKQAMDLRRQAEELSRREAVPPLESLGASTPEMSRTLHELRIHQIELEIQNEELQRTQGELEASLNRYFDLYDLAPVGYFTLSEKGLIIEANFIAATLLGLTKSSLDHQHFGLLVSKEDQDIYYQKRIQLFKTGNPQTCELRMVKKDDTEFFAHLDAVAAKDAGGAAVCRVALSDITARKQAEEKLSQSEERYRTLLSRAVDGIFIMTTDGKLVEVNESFARMHGYSTDEMLRMSLSTLDTPVTAQLFPERMKRILADEALRFEVEHYHKDGHVFPLEVSASRISVGNKTYIQCFHRDITERKQAEAALQEAHDLLERRVAERTVQLQESTFLAQELAVKAEAANRTKSAFLANMSHEIRTPLSGVLGMTGLLLGTSLTDKQRNYAEKIKISGDFLLATLNDILDFSKLQASKLGVENIPFPPKSVIENVAAMFSPQAAEKGIKLHIAIDPVLPRTLMGDPQRLAQVLNNLLSNAVKFTQAGEVRLAVGVQRQTTAAVELEISVQDTGIGMTEEELSRLFTAFSQADTSLSRRYGGTGLGLAISLNLVELMGGTLRAKSAPGKGSTFTILLSFPIEFRPSS